MTKKMWSAGLFATVVVVGGGLFWTATSRAALPSRPYLSNPCNTFAAMDHWLSIAAGPVTQVSTPGSLTANPGAAFTTSDGRSGQNIDVAALSSAGDVKGVGTVDIEFDATRKGDQSTITANKAGAQFPATQRMNFFITMDVNGSQYRSINSVTLISTNVTSTPPAVGTSFDLAGPVDFESVDSPGKVAMTMQPGHAATITGHTAG
jgi:hypothetical protein